MKRSFILSLILMMIVSILSPIETIHALDSYEDSNIQASDVDMQGRTFCYEESYVNPLYENVTVDNGMTKSTSKEYYSSPIYEANDYEMAVIELREKLKQRQTEIVIEFKVASDTGTLWNDLLNDAMAHTGIDDEGDYLKYHIPKVSGLRGGEFDENCYLDAVLTYNPTYYTTSEQEAKVTEEINKVMKSLNLDGLSDYQKVKAIYDYICNNVKYDHENVNNSDNTIKYTAYAALINKTSVCQGYASLLYRMLLLAGVDSRVVTGYAPQNRHAWNIVELNNMYYYLDSTWDCGLTSYEYFLKSYLTDHYLDENFTILEFKKFYPRASENYDVSASSEVVEMANGEAGTHVRWSLDSSGTLTISGSGEMTNFELPNDSKGFDSYVDQIYKIVVEEGITSVGDWAFYGLSQVETVELPNSLTRIGVGAFGYLDKMVKIVIPDNVTTIEDKAFVECSYLKSITMPSQCTKIGVNVFESCSRLNKLTLPRGISEFDVSNIAYCTNLKDIYFEGTDEEVNLIGTGNSQQKINGVIIHYHVHWFAINEVKSPTCTEPGYEKCVCRCGDFFYNYTQAKGHQYGSWVTIKESTGCTDGEKQATCKVCQHTLVKTIPATEDHTYTNVEVKNPTCQETGEFKYFCTKCQKTIVETLLKSSHTIQKIKKNEKKATCTTSGSYDEIESCTMCHEEFSRKTVIVPATGHNYVSVVTKATFDKAGKTVKACNDCGIISSTTTIPQAASAKLSATRYAYNGEAKKPKVILKDINGNEIDNDYYSVSYYDAVSNKKVTPASIGKYYAKVSLKGNYSGSKNLYFTIGPKNTSSVKATLYGYDDVQVTWSKVSGASGYEVKYRISGGSWTTKTTTGTSMKLANLSDGKKYEIKVSAYKNVSRNKCYNSGKTATIYTLKKVTGVKAATSSGKVKVSWNNIAGESGYQISKSTKSTGTSIVATYATTTGKSKTVSATKGKTYYYKVRAYKTVGSKKIYGPWSSAVKYVRK